MSDMPLQKKLQLKDGQALWVLNAPQGMPQTLAEALPQNPLLTESAPQGGAVLVFVTQLAEVESWMPRALAAVGPDGLALAAYAKGGSKIPTDLNRDVLAGAVEKLGWRPVRLVALDAVWSVMRFRPADKVGK